MKKLLLPLVLLFSSTCYCEEPHSLMIEAARSKSILLETDNISEIIPHVTENALLIFDLDNTVIRSKNSLGSAQWFYWMVQREMDKGKSREEARAKVFPYYTNIQDYIEVETVDEIYPQIIKYLQGRGQKIVAITSRLFTASTKTLEQLNELEIDFSNNPFSDYAFSFHHETPVKFYEGVLFTGDPKNKCAVFEDFLRQAFSQGIEFQKIVFIDDQKRNIQYMQECAKRLDLEYVGLRYSHEDDANERFNPEIAQKQFELLFNPLPDEVAKKILSFPEASELLSKYKDPIESPLRRDLMMESVEVENSSFPTDLPYRGKVIETDKIIDILEYASHKTLFVFDINDTLMSTSSCLGGDVWAHNIVKEGLTKGISREEVLDRILPFWLDVLIHSSFKPVEDETAQVIRRLQKEGSPIVAMTARITELAYQTIHQLRSIAIDFSNAPLAQSDFTINVPYPARYINGIIFAGLLNKKAEVLIQFLEQNPVEFDRIVFVDDKRKNVDELAQAAAILQKEYIGVHYRAVDPYAKHYDADVPKIQAVFFQKMIPDSIIEKLLEADES